MINEYIIKRPAQFNMLKYIIYESGYSLKRCNRAQ